LIYWALKVFLLQALWFSVRKALLLSRRLMSE